MKLIKSNPVTSSTRHYKYISKNILSKHNKLLKHLVFGIHRSFGKSYSTGHTTIWGRFSGCKKLFRKLSFFKQDTLGIILFSVYDPNRTAFVSAVFDFFFFKFFFIPAVHLVSAGCLVGCRVPNYKYFLGFRYPIFNQTQGSLLSSLSLKKNKKAQYVLSAGTYCQLLYKSLSFCKVRLPSNHIIKLYSPTFATLGTTSNLLNKFIVLGKAGRNRALGSKPKVRGIAMNPVDHPHGGRSNGGCCWVTPWGKPFRFKKTSRSKIFKTLKVN